MDQAWRNILAILDDAGMDAGNLVKITAYLTRRDDLKAFREMRDRHLTDVTPASTLPIVSALAGPGWLVETGALAAKYSGRRGPPPRSGFAQHGGLADAARHAPGLLAAGAVAGVNFHVGAAHLPLWTK